jgi:PleD family two-component response regulator
MLVKKHVLVIDDEPKREIQRILENQGFRVTWCEDWNAAKQLFAQPLETGVMPDIVLVDMHFYPPHNILSTNPAMEGVLIIKKLFELCAQYTLVPPPIIGFTGRADYLQRQKMIQFGVTDFITADEFKDRTTLGRRLMQCIQEAQVSQILKPPGKADIHRIEENIVQCALELNANDPYKASQMLNWKLSDVIVVKNRLEEKSHVA